MHIPALNFGGVTLTEKNMYNYNNPCLFSTVIFTGTLSILIQLNGVMLTGAGILGTTDTVTIVVPSKLECMHDSSNSINHHSIQFS